MKSITKIKGKYYECDTNENNDIEFIAGKEYYIPIVKNPKGDLKEINISDEKAFILETCKSIDVNEAIRYVLTGRLGYCDIYGRYIANYLKPVYLVNCENGVEEITLQEYLNKYARTIKLLADEGYLDKELITLVEPIEGDFKIDENLFETLKKINDIVGDYYASFKLEDDVIDFLVRMQDGVKLRSVGVKDNFERFGIVIGEKYALPYKDTFGRNDVLDMKDVTDKIEDEESYVRNFATRFHIKVIVDYFKYLLASATKDNATKIYNTCKLLNDEIICCTQINEAIKSYLESLNRDILDGIINALMMAEMMGQLENQNATSGEMNFF